MRYMSEETRVLHVDDDPAFVDLADDVFRADDGVDLATATNMDDGFDLLENQQFDCVVSDYVTAPNGEAFVTTVSEEYPDLPVILFTGTAYEDIDDPEVRESITDYLQKGSTADPFDSLSERIAAQTGMDDWETVTEFDPRNGDSFVVALVNALREHAGELPEQATPLGDYLDVEAAGRILESATTGEQRPSVTIRFAVGDSVVRVDDEGAIAVRSP